jgi:hypothetical protein
MPPNREANPRRQDRPTCDASDTAAVSRPADRARPPLPLLLYSASAEGHLVEVDDGSFAVLTPPAARRRPSTGSFRLAAAVHPGVARRPRRRPEGSGGAAED